MATSETKQYKSPVDGSRLQLIRRDGQKDVTYRDASTGVEYSAAYAKENFEEVKAESTAKKASTKKAAQTGPTGSTGASGASGASGAESGASGASGASGSEA